jgi:hypothetical protein
MKEINEDQLHELARLFMYQLDLPLYSLDEFLMEHSEILTQEEKNLGYFILDMFNN